MVDIFGKDDMCSTGLGIATPSSVEAGAVLLLLLLVACALKLGFSDCSQRTTTNVYISVTHIA